GSPTRWALIFPVVEGALRYGLVGGAGAAIALIPFFVFAEWWRAHRFGPPGFVSDRVSFPAGVLLLTGLIVGWLVERLNREAARAKEEAAEAAELRDQLGRRVDVLEASSRCARALGSPRLGGAGAIGLLASVREEPNACTPDEVDLVALLGRLAATAVQNSRSYEDERQTVEELRRLSALRADFVSLVSHELRSPMAAVIGAARTLQERWRTLAPEQREAFLALIADEKNRLANLIGDVLHTSQIEE